MDEAWRATVADPVKAGKGTPAAEESGGRLGRRFKSSGLEATEENRCTHGAPDAHDNWGRRVSERGMRVTPDERARRGKWLGTL